MLFSAQNLTSLKTSGAAVRRSVEDGRTGDGQNFLSSIRFDGFLTRARIITRLEARGGSGSRKGKRETVIVTKAVDVVGKRRGRALMEGSCGDRRQLCDFTT